MSPLSWLMITTSIVLSTTLITSTTHWLMAWTCLEINTLAMTPLISKPNHPRATEGATKYFLTQTLASTTILFATTNNAMLTSSWEIGTETNTTMMKIITLALMMKMAAAPFHYWLPEVSQGTTTMAALTILTWQKIAPLSVLLMTHNQTNHPLVMMSAILSVMWGGLGGLNQTQMRKLMAFSSIAHTGWTLATMTIAPNISTITFVIYTINTTPIFMTLSSTTSTTIKDLGTLWTTSPHLTAATSITILSLSGLPPLTGFMPKWLILNKMISFNFTMEATMMAMTSLFSLYLYLRMIYLTSMTLLPQTTVAQMKWRTTHKKHTMLASSLMVTATLMLPLTPSM
uniref:NADH-ubiquinone oxidoreductase chain 2 n=1 Tax=Pareas boulengeri TaxID=1090948 RepID=A0A7H1KJQ6_9SAUR|nr:NADH dehydrogenase subunit 2 [Pareas boulengeri]QNT27522.1 NADH dehydrogenase subunit 2 [Pareas boulengeri]